LEKKRFLEKRLRLVLLFVAIACAACSRPGNVIERIAVLPFENLTGDAALDWIATAGPAIVIDQLLGGAARAVPVQAGALRDAYAAGATQLVHGYFEKRHQSLHFEFAVEDAQTHKMLQTVIGDGDALPALDQLAKKLDPAAHPFSSTNSQAVTAWGRGEYQSAVSLDPDFGAAWLSWTESRAAAGDKQQASEIVAHGLAQSALRSPVDRAQLEFMSATLRQDQSAQQAALTTLVGLMPHDLPLLRRLAAQEMNGRQFSEAVRYYQAVIQEDPDDVDTWNMLGYAQAFAGDPDAARKSFERYGSNPANAANAIDSQGEALFLNGRFAEAEKHFLDAHSKSSAMLAGGDLLKAAYARWLQNDLAGADKLFSQYLVLRTQMNDALVPWRQAVWEYSTGRTEAAVARLSNVSTGPAANVARAQLALWQDPSKLPHDLAPLKQAFERTPPAADGITRVLYAAALLRAGQKDEARKLLALWPLPGAEADPLLQSFLFPKYLELKRELK
jgi:tetratricopeptide (TPR) repeat protein